MNKICGKCKVDKPYSSFHKKGDGYQHVCKSCCSDYNRQRYQRDSKGFIAKTKKRYLNDPAKAKIRNQKWILENTEKHKDSYLNRKYGISLEQYHVLMEEQNDCCAICKIHKSQLDYDLHVDHDHVSNKVRGLLCGDCNRGIGLFKDNPSTISNAVNYLKSFED